MTDTSLIAAGLASTKIITDAIGLVNKALTDTSGRNLIPVDEVVDALLDIRQTLDRCYLTGIPRTEVPA